MKKIVLCLILVIVFIDSSGQWYNRKFGVDRLDLLTSEQLDEAQAASKEIAIAGGGLLLLGGGGMLAGYLYLHNGLGEDPTTLEELLGAECLGKICLGSGAICLAAGAIAGLTGLIRMSCVRSVRNRYYTESSSDLSPIVIYDRYTGSSYPGFSLRINF